MAGKENLDDENFNVDIIFENCSSDFNKTHRELMDALKKEPAFMRLKSIGENQFYDATSKSSIEMESQITRSCYAEMDLMLEEVMQMANTLISKKLNHNFHNELEDLVLNTIMMLYPPIQKHVEGSTENETVLSPAGSFDKKQKSAGEKSSSEVSTDNSNNAKKEIIHLSDVEDAEKILSKKNKEHLSKSDDGNVDFGSFSSVHTSDLSSFDDSLVFSSDEETGVKGKRMSLQEAEKRLAELKSKKLYPQKSKENQKSKDASELKTPVKDSSVILQKSSRVRKPNSRYIADEIISPLKKTLPEKFPNCASTVDNPLKRKRGRPRKHVT